MQQTFEEEVISMLTPKIKSVLRQTTQQNQCDLEQDLILLVLTKINKGKFLDVPSFFELIEKENIA